MTRTLRLAHRILWLLFVFTVGSVFVLALLLRPPAHAATAAAMSVVRQ